MNMSLRRCTILAATVAALLGGPGAPASARDESFSVPMRRDVGGRVTVDAVLNGGHRLVALVDTRFSSQLLIKPEAAARAQLKAPRFLPAKSGRGVDGSTQAGRWAPVKIVRLGDQPGDWDMLGLVADRSVLKHDAILGMRFLGKYDITFNFEAGLLKLAPKGTLDNPPTGALSWASCGKRTATFSIGGCGEDAVYVDTGGQVTVMNLEMARRLGLPDGLTGRPEGPLTGAAGGKVPTMRYAHPVNLKGLRLPSILVAEFDGGADCKAPCAKAILGMDVLGQAKSLSFTDARITIVPSRAAL